jgi:hypothetical protein
MDVIDANDLIDALGDAEAAAARARAEDAEDDA